MNSKLLSALDVEESGNGKGFGTTISYGNRNVKSSDKDDDDSDDIIIVDKKQTYSLKKTGPVTRAKPPLSRQHKAAVQFSSKDIGRIPKISTPKITSSLPNAKDCVEKTYQSYQSSRTLRSKEGTNNNCVEQDSQDSPTEVVPPEITLYATPNFNNQSVFVLTSPGPHITTANLVPGILQITPPNQKGQKRYQIVPQNQAIVGTSFEVLNGNQADATARQSITCLPTQMTPSPVKIQKLHKSPEKTEENSPIENDKEDSSTVKLALCANCGIKSRSLITCDSCRCNFSGKKYKKLINVAKEDLTPPKNNVQLNSGPFLIQNFYSKNKSSTLLLPVKRRLPPSTSSSSNWKETYRLKTYTLRRQKKPVEPVCISISSDEEEPVCQDEDTSNNLDNAPVSPVFDRLSDHLPRRNGQVEYDSDSELKTSSHHRTDDKGCGSGYNTPVRLTRKQRMRNQNEELVKEKIPKNSKNVRKRKQKADDLSDSSLDDMDITVEEDLRCVTVEASIIRIGNQEHRTRTSVEFQWNKVVLHLSASLRSSEQLELKTSELVSCVFFISSSLFSVFLETIPAVGNVIRDRFKMDNSVFYDPNSSDHSKKTINIHADKLTQKEVLRLRKLLDSYKAANTDLEYVELNKTTLDLISEKILPKSEEVKDQQKVPFEWDETTPTSTSSNHSSSRRTITGTQRAQPMLHFIYPPNESKGRISVTSEDVVCLEEGEFINDVIIDFYLKFLLHEVLSVEDRERTHIFSSFFYKRLSRRVTNTSKFDTGPQQSVAERRHGHVKSWTRNVDLFKKDFVIIPVNESAHWYVAVVCFPGLSKAGAGKSTIQKDTTDTGVSASEDVAEPSSNNDDMDEQSTKPSPSKSIQQDVNESDGQEVKETDVESPAENPKASFQNGGDPQQEINKCVNDSVDVDSQNGVSCPEIIQDALRKSKEEDAANDMFHSHQSFKFKQPCILIFDSLKGTTKRNTCINKLKEYIAVEWKIKKGNQREFEFKGMQPEVPQQSNYHDCGVYVLQYVESFFTMPIKNYSTPLKGLSQWFKEERVNRKREDIKVLISNISERQQGKR